MKLPVIQSNAVPRGVVLYRGKSMLNGKPIVVIATIHSKNEKTGDMISTWILRDNIQPIEALNRGEDDAVCGDCKHRNKTCYVRIDHAPRNIFLAYKRGVYPKFSTEKHLGLFVGRGIRLGAYGDPAAVPIHVWKPLLAVCGMHTGYTHAWKYCNDEYKDIVMASVDNEKEFRLARKMGYRTFRVRSIESGLMQGEFACPASEEGGKRLNCIDCGACSGTNGGITKNGNVAILVHGSPVKINVFKKMVLSGLTS